MTTVAIVGASIERWATEFRHLQRTEVLEAEEYFSKGQKGSSAMPHKRNPITGERLTGLARVLRGNAVAALENVALWHERDISHSSVERVIFPDSCTLLNYMLHKLTDLTKGLIVYPKNMEKNLCQSLGMWNSQSVLLALIRKGLTREESYSLVQRNAMETWKTKHDGRDDADFLNKTQSLAELGPIVGLSPEGRVLRWLDIEVYGARCKYERDPSYWDEMFMSAVEEGARAEAVRRLKRLVDA